MTCKTKLAYKLMRLRKNGTLGSLFISRKDVIPVGAWLKAESIPTRGFAHRPGWHVAPAPFAPHLSTSGRVWMHVEISDYRELIRPDIQGGAWWIAEWMRVLNPVEDNNWCREVDGCDCVHCRRYVLTGGTGPIQPNSRPTKPFFPWTLAREDNT